MSPIAGHKAFNLTKALCSHAACHTVTLQHTARTVHPHWTRVETTITALSHKRLVLMCIQSGSWSRATNLGVFTSDRYLYIMQFFFKGLGQWIEWWNFPYFFSFGFECKSKRDNYKKEWTMASELKDGASLIERLMPYLFAPSHRRKEQWHRGHRLSRWHQRRSCRQFSVRSNERRKGLQSANTTCMPNVTLSSLLVVWTVKLLLAVTVKHMT